MSNKHIPRLQVDDQYYWRPSLVGWRMLEAISSRLEAIASRFEAMGHR